MLAYKGFNKDLTCTLGKGIYQYEPGKTVREERSKTANSGFHCTENPLECFNWYPLGQENRYWIVEAAGSLDECGTDAKIACTEMTLLKELTIAEMAAEAMAYMIRHPVRSWEVSGNLLEVKRDRAIGAGEGSIAIARGEEPKAKGKAGSVIGLLAENDTGEIITAKLFRIAGKWKEDTWYSLDGRELKEVEE